jgi:hypothetical protein
MIEYPLIIDYVNILKQINHNREECERVFNEMKKIVEEKQIKVKLANSDYLWKP